ncbi:MAG: hypothetical protein JXQ87_18230 [Bacteroidia bacterium]
MRKLEIGIITVAVAAVIIKVVHFTGSSVLAMSLLALVSIVYLFFGWYIFNPSKTVKETESKTATRKILLSVAHALLAIAVLFKLQLWPYANVLLISSGVLASIMYLYSKGKLRRAIYLMAISFLLFGFPNSIIKDIYGTNDQPTAVENAEVNMVVDEK